MSITQRSKIIVRNGIEAQLPTTLGIGELAWTTDTHKLYIGNGTTNEQVNTAGSISSSAIISALGYTPENIANKNISSGYLGIDLNNRVGINVAPDGYSNISTLTINGTGSTNSIYCNTNGTGTASTIQVANGYGPIGYIGTSGSSLVIGRNTATPTITIDSNNNTLINSANTNFYTPASNTSVTIGKLGEPNVYYNSLQIFSAYNTTVPTWSIGQDYTGCRLDLGQRLHITANNKQTLTADDGMLTIGDPVNYYNTILLKSLYGVGGNGLDISMFGSPYIGSYTSGLNICSNSGNDEKYRVSTPSSKLTLDTVGNFVFYTAPAGIVGTVIPWVESAKLGVSGLSIFGTGAIKVPAGTIAQRPTPAQGMVRYVTDGTPGFEGYNGTAWAPFAGSGSASYYYVDTTVGQHTWTKPAGLSATALVIVEIWGGGGGGGNSGGGGGGAYNRLEILASNLSSTVEYFVASGGAAGPPTSGSGSQGTISNFGIPSIPGPAQILVGLPIEAYGGGGGGGTYGGGGEIGRAHV